MRGPIHYRVASRIAVHCFGIFDNVGMLTVLIIGGRDLLYVGLWMVVNCSVIVSQRVAVVSPLLLVSCVGEESPFYVNIVVE